MSRHKCTKELDLLLFSYSQPLQVHLKPYYKAELTHILRVMQEVYCSFWQEKNYQRKLLRNTSINFKQSQRKGL